MPVPEDTPRPSATQSPSTLPDLAIDEDPQRVQDTVRKQVEARRQTIRELYLEIAQLHRIHNLLPPINSLPPELLTMIFSFVEASSEEDCKDLLNITHVCNRWRAVAIGTPVLWTRISFTHSGGVDAFLQRSKNQPLHVTVHTRELVLVSTIRSLTKEIHRTRSLKVAIPASFALNVVAKKLFGHTPQLEELCLERLPQHEEERRFTVAFPMEPADFDGAPALRSLKLRGIPLPYLPRGPNKLTNVDLGGFLPSLSILLDLLERSPQLKRLSLHGLFNEDAEEDPRKVSLPHLETLEVHSFHATGIASFLPSLSLPKSTNISLFASLDIGEDFGEIIPPYDSETLLDIACLQGMKRLQLAWRHEELWLQAFRGADDFHTPALQVKANIFDPHPGPRFFGDWPIDTSHVEALSLCGSFTQRHPYDFPIVSPTWAVMLESLPALKTLRIMSVCNKTLEDLLFELRTGDELEDLLFCPGLESLEFFDVGPSAAFWTSLVNLVTARQTSGALKRVELFNVGDIPQGTLSCLWGAGVTVVLDETELA
ncbi:hypothetical protein C8Q77DRAFT_1097128 [Trametes polyzona]|nr:hypothetical protein C8Q77DRAFT_1097128 [Trametes polyzona]